ncbi:MAG: glycosyltransferase [Flavobacteriales bacterium]|nr:glycosyltransferase [Flavobacteriales bacterium]
MNHPNNICFFNTTPFWGGGEKWHFEAAQLAVEQQIPCFFVCQAHSALAEKLEPLPVKQFHLSVSNRSFLNPIKVNALVRFFTDNQIETVIFNSPKDLKIGAKAAKKAGVKTIVYRRGIAVEVKPKALTERLFRDAVTHFIFNSEATKSLVEKHYRDILATKKKLVLYNAIELKNEPGSSHPNNPIIIGNAGRLVEQKGQLLLIEVAKKLSKKGIPFEMHIAGEGPLEPEIRTAIEQNNLTGQVKLLGFVEDMQTFMQHIDIFVSTALWEGFGFVLAEAMAVKKPVLAFDLSSNPELVKDGVNGFLIQPNNTSAFAEKLAQLIGDAALRKQMGQAGYTFVEDHFERQKQFGKLMEFLSV